ncbi:MAG: hypothetical protein OFPII_17760 [Osedax symbiont Rs1]|nr:MAG: hypothetical protein OFPII_17760 [Osedax symbiont Rs1]
MDAVAQSKTIDAKSPSPVKSIEAALPAGKTVHAKVTHIAPDTAQPNAHRITLKINNTQVEISAKFSGNLPEKGSVISLLRSDSGQIQLKLVKESSAEPANSATSTAKITSGTSTPQTLKATPNNAITATANNTASSTTSTSNNLQIPQGTSGNVILKAPVTINASGPALNIIEQVMPKGTVLNAKVINQQQVSGDIPPRESSVDLNQGKINLLQAKLNSANTSSVPANSNLVSQTPKQPIGNSLTIKTNLANTVPKHSTRPIPAQNIQIANQLSNQRPNQPLSPPTANTSQKIAGQLNAPNPASTSNIAATTTSPHANTTVMERNSAGAGTRATQNTVNLTDSRPANPSNTGTANHNQNTLSSAGSGVSSAVNSTSNPLASPVVAGIQNNTAVKESIASNSNPLTAKTSAPTAPPTQNSPIISRPLVNTQNLAQPTNPSIPSAPVTTSNAATLNPTLASAGQFTSSTATPSNSTNNIAQSVTAVQSAKTASTAPTPAANPANPSPTVQIGVQITAPAAPLPASIAQNLQLSALATQNSTLKIEVAGRVVSLQAPANLPPLQNLQITRTEGTQANIQWQQPSQVATASLSSTPLTPQQVKLIDHSLRQALPQQIPIADGINLLVAQSIQIANASNSNKVPIDKIALSLMQLFGVKPGANNSSDTIKRNIQQGGLFTEGKVVSQPNSHQGDMKGFLAKLNHLAEQLPTEQKEMLQSTTERMLARITTNQLTHVQQQHTKTDISNERTFQIDIPVQNNEKLDNVKMEIKQRKHLTDEGDFTSIWSVKLHFDLEERGEVDAEVALNPEDNSISTTFLCSKLSTVQELEKRMTGFRAQLNQQGFEIQTLHCTQGSQTAAANNSINKRIIDIRT